MSINLWIAQVICFLVLAVHEVEGKIDLENETVLKSPPAGETGHAVPGRTAVEDGKEQKCPSRICA